MKLQCVRLATLWGATWFYNFSGQIQNGCQIQDGRKQNGWQNGRQTKIADKQKWRHFCTLKTEIRCVQILNLDDTYYSRSQRLAWPPLGWLRSAFQVLIACRLPEHRNSVKPMNQHNQTNSAYLTFIIFISCASSSSVIINKGGRYKAGQKEVEG